jgi:hypothetical protein
MMTRKIKGKRQERKSIARGGKREAGMLEK